MGRGCFCLFFFFSRPGGGRRFLEGLLSHNFCSPELAPSDLAPVVWGPRKAGKGHRGDKKVMNKRGAFGELILSNKSSQEVPCQSNSIQEKS